MKLLKSIPIISILLNLVFGIIFSIYYFTPVYDFVIINKSLPRLCNIAKEEHKELPMCQLDELVENQKTIIQQNSNSTFKLDTESNTYWGEIELQGYVDLVEIPKGFCDEDCIMNTYLFFKIQNGITQELANFLKAFESNTFVKSNSFSIGCLQDGNLIRVNGYENKGFKEYQNTKKETELLQVSKKEEPIKIRLKKHINTLEGGAPDCFSHFDELQIVN